MFVLGLMSKPVLVVTLPCVLLLLDYWPLGRMQKAEGTMQNAKATDTHHAPRNTLHVPPPLLLEKLPFFALSALASVMTFLAQKQAGTLGTNAYLPLGARVGNALISYCRYLGKLFWPRDLAVFYPHPGHWPLAEGAAGGGGACGHFGAGLGAAAAASLFADGVAVVLWDAGAGDRTGRRRAATRWPTVSLMCRR